MKIIIGAGISGLYLGWELLKKNVDFVILEKSDRTGGRLWSEYTSNGKPVELGASVFHSNQEIIMSLMNEFNIEIVPIYTGKTYYDELDCPEKFKYPKEGQGKVEDVIPEIEICGSHFDEIREMNYNTWKRSYDDVKQVYICKNGFQELIDKMTQALEDYIFLEQHVQEIKKDYLICNGKKMKFEHAIICTSSSSAKKIKGINQDVFNLVKSIPSCRFYVELNVDIHTEYQYFVSDKLYRWAIVVGPRLLLASYTDGKRADLINKIGKEKAERIILSELDIKEDEVVNKWFVYWKDGFDIVRWNANPRKVKDSIELQPNVYQTFVPDSERNGQDQSWLEAHLRTSKSVLNKLTNKHKGV